MISNNKGDSTPSIVVKNLTVKYQAFSKKNNNFALKNINISLSGHKLVVIAGSSGSGKSTLANVLLGLIPRFVKAHVSGTVLINGRSPTSLSQGELIKLIGYVPQYPADYVTSLLIEEEIAFPLENMGIRSDIIEERIKNACKNLDMTELRKRLITEISAGELQRVALATALAANPPILILDEPLARIDSSSEEKLALTFKKIASRGHLVVIFEHNLDYLLPIADLVIILENGELISKGPPHLALTKLNGVDLPEILQLQGINCKSNETYIDSRELMTCLTRLLKRKKATLLKLYSSSKMKDFHNQQNVEITKATRLDAATTITLTIKDVEYTYHDAELPALANFTWQRKSPGIIGLIGKNGSGKTTLLKIITGFLRIKRGEIVINGKKITSIKDAQKFTCQVPENAKLFLTEPTPLKDLSRILNNQEKANILYEKQPLLANIRNRKMYHLSEGQRRLVAIFNAFHVPKPVLLFDEPTIGLDSKGRLLFQKLARKAKEQGKILLVATNDSRLFTLFDEILVLSKGKMILKGHPRQILYQLSEVADIIPGQIIHFIKELETALEMKLPHLLTAAEFNNFLNQLRSDPS